MEIVKNGIYRVRKIDDISYSSMYHYTAFAKVVDVGEDNVFIENTIERGTSTRHIQANDCIISKEEFLEQYSPVTKKEMIESYLNGDFSHRHMVKYFVNTLLKRLLEDGSSGLDDIAVVDKE